jgi:predicted mannosyl-3-phosphoglycerate phosphatase (HAD superfamily)
VAVSPVRVEWYLGNWADWMLRSKEQTGYGRGSIGFNQSGSLTFEDMCAAGDVRLARITATAIEDLTPLERAAVNHEYLQTVWTFPADWLDGSYDRALWDLAMILNRKGLD